MKQILQNLKTGLTQVTEVPTPGNRPGHFLVCTRASLVSAGTERMLVEFGRAGFLSKARQQPDKVRQVLNKVRTDGLLPTIEAVQSKLDQPIRLGYCNVGMVCDLDAEEEKSGMRRGDRVVSNGSHAEVVCVSKNLCSRVPDGVDDEEAAFTVLGAVGLQGVRLAQPTLGECFVVTGLGLLGLLTVQILLAQGCRVQGIDLDSSKCALAREFGASTVDLSKGEDPVAAGLAFSRGRGVDGVIVTAATKSNEPVHQAAQMCRKRGRIVLVGVAGLDLKREDFYEKELSFQVSCSYGPGRYDPDFEERGNDYPIGFVRWTEQRNFEAVLDLMAAGRLNVRPLISHRFRLEDAEKAYAMIANRTEPYLGIVLQYPEENRTEDGQVPSRLETRTVATMARQSQGSSKTKVVAGVIGAGNFTGQVLLPALRDTGAMLRTIVSSSGVTGTHLAKKFGFEESTTDAREVFSNPRINTVFITTRHDSHARYVLQALAAGKHVFVEKPLCLTPAEMDDIISAYQRMMEGGNGHVRLMVGYNRRFAPHVIRMKALLDAMREPKSLIMTVNAGFIPPDHWTQDRKVGGGRIIGEACHFVDLLRFLTGYPIVDIQTMRMTGRDGAASLDDKATLSLSFADGSIGTVHYFANGHKSFPKERLEVFCGGRILQLDNFRVLRGYGWPGFRQMKLWRLDKGHRSAVQAFVQATVDGGDSPIPFEELTEVMRSVLQIADRGNGAASDPLLGLVSRLTPGS